MPMPNHYTKGSQVVVIDTLTSPKTGLPVTAPLVNGSARDPLDVKHTYPTTQISTNQWQMVISADTPGVWNWRMETPPGPGEGACEGVFVVDPSVF